MSAFYQIDELGMGYVEGATEIARAISDAAVQVDELGEFPEAAIDLLQKQGYMGLCLPTEFGGHGQSPSVYAAVVEQLAKGCPSTAMIFVMHITASRVIADSATFAFRDEVLRDICAGKHLTTLSLSERGSRSQFWTPVSQLRDNENGYLTSAKKSWVTSAHHADSYVSSALSPDAETPRQSTLYFVRRRSPRVKVAGEFNGLGLRGNDSAPVEITNLEVDEGDLLTAHDEGRAVMMGPILQWFAVGSAAMAHGLCLSAIDATTSHLCGSGFAHSGNKLCDLPNLRARLAEMACRADQSRAFLGHVVAEMAAGDSSTELHILQARLSALETALHVTDLAMKTCGGAAFSKHLALERIFRDARAGWVMAPTVDHLQDFIGRKLTGMPLT